MNDLTDDYKKSESDEQRVRTFLKAKLNLRLELIDLNFLERSNPF